MSTNQLLTLFDIAKDCVPEELFFYAVGANTFCIKLIFLASAWFYCAFFVHCTGFGVKAIPLSIFVQPAGMGFSVLAWFKIVADIVYCLPAGKTASFFVYIIDSVIQIQNSVLLFFPFDVIVIILSRLLPSVLFIWCYRILFGLLFWYLVKITYNCPCICMA